MPNIFLYGPPACGKGISKEYILRNHPYLKAFSIGDILRQKFGQDDPRFLSGVMFPNDIINNIISQFIQENGKTNILFDGCPRHTGQLEHLVNLGIQFDLVLNLWISKDEMIKRISRRMVHVNSGRIYDLEICPPKNEGKDDLTGEELLFREDDKVEIAKKRYDVYLDNHNQIIQHLQGKKSLHYKQFGVEAHIVDLSTMTALEVTQEKIKEIISETLIKS